jgi:hypothetical protein
VVLSGDEKFIRNCLWWCGRGRNFEISSLKSGGFWLRLGRHSSVMALQKLPVKKVETVVIDNNPCRCKANAPLSRLGPPAFSPSILLNFFTSSSSSAALITNGLDERVIVDIKRQDIEVSEELAEARCYPASRMVMEASPKSIVARDKVMSAPVCFRWNHAMLQHGNCHDSEYRQVVRRAIAHST